MNDFAFFFIFLMDLFLKWGCKSSCNDCNLFKKSGNRANPDLLALCCVTFLSLWKTPLFIYSGHILSFMSFLRLIPASMAASLPLSPASKLPVLTELMSQSVLAVFSFWICVGLQRRRALCVLPLFDRSSVFRDGGGGNSGDGAALMFNSSLFVLNHGNHGLPLGVCRWPRVCCCVEMSQSPSGIWWRTNPRMQTTAGWGGLFAKLPHQWCKQPISSDTQVMSLFNNSSMMHLFMLYKGI